ncbi:hypothetical protein R1sor_008950 [Riccia sorocarpa]|uniref:Reverse transcriptase domain-containing protein n=1 Tax=Riccia sorocarpa TaxID=122646 RepID=A0ABD3H6A5_9MARC
METAKRSKKELFVLFIDFSKAFDSISRSLLWEKLSRLEIPQSLLHAIALLYQNVRVKISKTDPGVESTLGVIQGCPLSPTLFGLVLDDLFWQDTKDDRGVKLGDAVVRMLLFADDVVFVSNSAERLRSQIEQLEHFCSWSQMNVNLLKTKWLRVGRGSPVDFYFQEKRISECYYITAIDEARKATLEELTSRAED